MINLHRLKTSRHELIDITKAWLVLSLAFAFVYAGINLFRGNILSIFSLQFLFLFLISMFTAGIGFLFHELAHKVVAQRYGCAAEFRAFDQMLYLALGLAAVVGFIFAAPGAVMISGQVTRKENGLISAAGPLTNYVLGGIFFLLLSVLPSWANIFSVGLGINMWLGLFNLIPFGPLDGLKVFYWNKAVWGILAVLGILVLFF